MHRLSLISISAENGLFRADISRKPKVLCFLKDGLKAKLLSWCKYFIDVYKKYAQVTSQHNFCSFPVSHEMVESKKWHADDIYIVNKDIP